MDRSNAFVSRVAQGADRDGLREGVLSPPQKIFCYLSSKWSILVLCLSWI